MPQHYLQALQDLSFTAIDFETANEKRHSACSIGIVQVRGGQIADTRQYLIRPVELRVSPMNYSVHRISAEQLRTAPTLPQLWPLIEPFLHDQVVVAHNAAFDMSVLDHSLTACALPAPTFHSMCSIKLMKASHPNLGGYRLNELAAHFGLKLNHHDSLSDALACAELTLRALRSGHPFTWSFKQRDLTKGFGSTARPRPARTWRC
jgi:DNA polymerase-3 subunit epsilon